METIVQPKIRTDKPPAELLACQGMDVIYSDSSSTAYIAAVRLNGKMLWGRHVGLTPQGEAHLKENQPATIASDVVTAEPQPALAEIDEIWNETAEVKRIVPPPVEAYIHNPFALFTVAGNKYTSEQMTDKLLNRTELVEVPSFCKVCHKMWSWDCREHIEDTEYKIVLRIAPKQEAAPKPKKEKRGKKPEGSQSGIQEVPAVLGQETAVPLLAASTVPLTIVEKPEPNLEELRRAAQLLFTDGQVVELRAFDTPEGTWGGYYDNFDTLAQDTFDLSARETTPNIYWTLQSISKDLLARRANNAKGWIKKSDLTDDKHVLRYRWLFIDFDPRRVSKISSTDAEKKAAYDLALRVRGYLAEKGFIGVFCDSGNGYHLLIRVDLTADKEGVLLVKELVHTLCAVFSTPLVDMDKTVFNPSRIFKAYGSVARKGEHTAERPWRVSRMLDVPQTPPAAKEQLEGLLQILKSDAKTVKDVVTATNISLSETVIEEEIRRLGLETSERTTRTDAGGNEYTQWHLVCPFNPDHKNKDAYIWLTTDGPKKGAWGFHCSHNSCSENKKSQFIAAVGGFNFKIPASVQASTSRLTLVPANSRTPKHIRWSWDGKILANKPNVIFGEPGLGKGFVGTDFIARMTTGGDFYDCANDNEPCGAIVCCSEDSWDETILPRLLVAGADINRIFFLEEEHDVAGSVEEGLMALGTDLPKIAEMLAQNADKNIRVILIDPLATYMGELDSNKDREVRPIYTAMAKFAEKHDICFVLIAHPNKNEEASAINRLSGAKALTSVFRNTWLVEKDPDKKGERLMLSVKGNLAGEGAKTGLRFRVDNVEDTGVLADDGETIRNIGKLAWIGTTDKDADTVLMDVAGGGREAKRKIKDQIARDFLKAYLAEGAQPAQELYEKTAASDIGEYEIRRAKSSLRLKWKRIGGIIYWALSKDHLDAKEAELLKPTVIFGDAGVNLDSTS